MSFAFKSASPVIRAAYRPVLSSAPSTSAARAFVSSPVACAAARPTKKAGSSAAVSAAKKKAAARVAALAEDPPNAMPLAEAFNVLRAWEIARPTAAISVAVQVVPDKAKPSMRGRTTFHRDPTTKPEIIYVFCKGKDIAKALEAGATLAGGEELIDKVLKGNVRLPTSCLATDEMAPTLLENKVLTRFLGPKGLLPQKKRGTVVADVTSAVEGLKGVLDWRVSKQNMLQAAVARVNFTVADVEANLLALLNDLRMCGSVAASFDGEAANYTEITSVALTSTQGPHIYINDVTSKLKVSEDE